MKGDDGKKREGKLKGEEGKTKGRKGGKEGGRQEDRKLEE